MAFQTNSGNLIGDGNHESHILVKDRQTGAFERVSATSAGEPADLLSEHPDITPDGRFVTFFSLATNLVADDTNNRRDIFVRDRQTGTVVRVSVSTAGEEGNSESQWPSISDDGLVTAFQSSADNLVLNANGGIFVHDDHAAADLSVTKSDSPDPVSKGAALTYSIEHMVRDTLGHRFRVVVANAYAVKDVAAHADEVLADIDNLVAAGAGQAETPVPPSSVQGAYSAPPAPRP